MAWLSADDEKLQDNDGEFWNPEKGDELQGIVKVVKIGSYDKYFMIIEDDAGDVWITTQCAGLDYQIKKLDIQPEDEVYLIYNGRRDDENHSHDYKLNKWVEDEEAEDEEYLE